MRRLLCPPIPFGFLVAQPWPALVAEPSLEEPPEVEEFACGPTECNKISGIYANVSVHIFTAKKTGSVCLTPIQNCTICS